MLEKKIKDKRNFIFCDFFWRFCLLIGFLNGGNKFKCFIVLNFFIYGGGCNEKEEMVRIIIFLVIYSIIFGVFFGGKGNKRN